MKSGKRNHCTNGKKLEVGRVLSKLSSRLNHKLEALEARVLQEAPNLSPDARLEVYEAISQTYSNKLTSIRSGMNSLKKVSSGK